jgi:dTDP-glucose pyrophosphorylase
MNLVVTMAGHGSRFVKTGVRTPKPLVLFREKPLFWWATQSALSGGIFEKIHFAVLDSHIVNFKIDEEILKFYPNASIHRINRVTSGAAETGASVAEKLAQNELVAFVDCDLAFSFQENDPFSSFLSDQSSGALCIFKSTNSAYSYAQIDFHGNILGTHEKVVVSDKAIAGFYIFSRADKFLEYFHQYINECPYSELFMSGIFNLMLRNNEKIVSISLSKHLSLGTPQDIDRAMLEIAPPFKWDIND